MANKKNVFKEFDEVVDILGDKPEFNQGLVPVMMHELSNYYASYRWARTDTERSFRDVRFKGMSLSDRSISLGVTASTYRSTGTRLTEKINKLLFDGKSLTEVVFGGNEELQQQVLNVIVYQNRRLDEGDVVPTDITNRLIREATVNPEGYKNVPEVLKACAFLALFSKDNIRYLMNHIDPGVLRYVVKTLDEDYPSEELLYYTCAKNLYRNNSEKELKKYADVLSRAPKKYEVLFKNYADFDEDSN